MTSWRSRLLCMLCAMLMACACASAQTQAVTDLAYDDILYFWNDMSHELRAAYSAEWIPKVEAELAVNPAYRGFHYYETRHVYGVPDEGCITEEAARGIAAAQIAAAYGVALPDWTQVYMDVYFDVCDTENPLWKLYAAVDEIDPWRFFWVEIEAKTGEIHRLIERDQTMEHHEFY